MADGRPDPTREPIEPREAKLQEHSKKRGGCSSIGSRSSSGSSKSQWFSVRSCDPPLPATFELTTIQLRFLCAANFR